jgi:hypothetical protein
MDMVGHEKVFAIGGEYSRDRFSLNFNVGCFLPQLEVKEYHRIIEPIADEKTGFVFREDRTHGGMASGKRCD